MKTKRLSKLWLIPVFIVIILIIGAFVINSFKKTYHATYDYSGQNFKSAYITYKDMPKEEIREILKDAIAIQAKNKGITLPKDFEENIVVSE